MSKNNLEIFYREQTFFAGDMPQKTKRHTITNEQFSKMLLHMYQAKKDANSICCRVLRLTDIPIVFNCEHN